MRVILMLLLIIGLFLAVTIEIIKLKQQPEKKLLCVMKKNSYGETGYYLTDQQ